MTKRYLESLPAEQQNDILGLPPTEAEWADYQRYLAEKGDIETPTNDEADREWAQALTDETEES